MEKYSLMIELYDNTDKQKSSSILIIQKKKKAKKNYCYINCQKKQIIKIKILYIDQKTKKKN